MALLISNHLTLPGAETQRAEFQRPLFWAGGRAGTGRYPESLGTSTQPSPAGATVTEAACPAVPQFSGLGVKASAAAWERVNGFLAEVQSHSGVSRWFPCSLAAVHTHPPVPLARQTAGSRYSVHTGPGIQGTAGGDLLGSLTPLPFQHLLGPGLSWGQVSGAGGHSLHSQTHLGFVLSSGPVPQMTWVRLKKGPGPSWLVEVAQGGVGPGGGDHGFPTGPAVPGTALES